MIDGDGAYDRDVRPRLVALALAAVLLPPAAAGAETSARAAGRLLDALIARGEPFVDDDLEQVWGRACDGGRRPRCALQRWSVAGALRETIPLPLTRAARQALVVRLRALDEEGASEASLGPLRRAPTWHRPVGKPRRPVGRWRLEATATELRCVGAGRDAPLVVPLAAPPTTARLHTHVSGGWATLLVELVAADGAVALATCEADGDGG
jgi:hypothetical protein